MIKDMTFDIELEYDSDDPNFLSVDELFDAVKKNRMIRQPLLR